MSARDNGVNINTDTVPPFIEHCFNLAQQVGGQKEGRKVQQGCRRRQLCGRRDGDGGGEEGKDNASGILKQHGDDIMLIETGRAGRRRGCRRERFSEWAT